MKKFISTVLAVLALGAMELLLMIMLVDPDWFRDAMVIVGLILLGLVLCAVLIQSGGVFGRIAEKKKADAYISSLREKHSNEIEQMNTQHKGEIDRLSAHYKGEIYRLNAQHKDEVYDLNKEHLETVNSLNENIVRMSEQMSDLGSQLEEDES